MKNFYKIAIKTLKFLIIFAIITGWLFSGWPQIFNPSTLFRTGFPPEIQEAQAQTTDTYTLTQNTTNGFGSWTVPVGVTSADVACWGAGGGGGDGKLTGGGGGGGGAFASSTLSGLAAGTSYTIFIGAGGTGATTDTVAGTNGAASTFATTTVVAAPGWGGAGADKVDSAGGVGGATASSTGTTLKAGGNGGGGLTTGDLGGGGGGAGGPHAAGVGGTTGGAGGAGDGGSPPGGAGGATGLAGTDDTDGGGGGGGGADGGKGGAGGVPGGGGGGGEGNGDNGAGGQCTVTYTIPPTTFLGNDTNPGVNPTIAPGAATTTVDTFSLKADIGTNIVSNATTTLATGTGTSTVAVLITNSANSTTYCTVYNPTSDVVGLTGCNLPVTTASTTFNVRIKPLTHSAMPAPPGGAYAVTALITAITATTTTSGTDTTSDTVTIDNASPAGATATSGSAGDKAITLNWTTSSGENSTSTVLRWQASSPGAEKPAEGQTYAAGNTITDATVACVFANQSSATVLSKIDGTGGSAGCTTAALTNGTAYSYKVFQQDAYGNYDVGVDTNLYPFTPAVGLTLAQNNYRIYENKDAIQPDYALGSENASSTVAQGEAFRIRMNLLIGGSDLASSTKQFKLQFNTASSTTGWIDIGKIASTSAIFRGYDNDSVSNNATPTAVLLSTSIKRGTYQEEWLSDLGHEGANAGQDIEYDWVVFEQSATTSINYYFRMINSNNTALDNYINQAIVTVKPRTYTQNNYQWFANLDSLTPGPSLNQKNTGISLVTNSDVKRLRIDMTVGNVGLATSSKKFKLEYKTLGGGCEVAESWTAVGAIGSGEIWRGYNNASVSDGATTTIVYLNSANRFETYEEENNTASSTTRIELGQYGEYDWVVQDNSAPLDTTYCFRMATTTGGAFNTYNNYPRLITANYQPNMVSGGGATEISPAGAYQTPTTTPSGGAPAESSPSGVYQVSTTTPSGGGGDSGFGPVYKFLAGIGYLTNKLLEQVAYFLKL